MNRNLKGILVFTGIAGLIFAGYKSKNIFDAVNQLEYKILDVKIVKRKNWTDYLIHGIDLIITVQVTNKSNSGIPFQGLNLDVTIDNEFIGNVKINKGSTVPPKSIINLNLQMNLEAEKIDSVVWDSLQKLLQNKTINVNVKGTIQGANVSFDINENIPVNSAYLLDS